MKGPDRSWWERTFGCDAESCGCGVAIAAFLLAPMVYKFAELFLKS